MDARFWDERYRENGFAYGDQPNDFLRDQAAALTPGDAICLAEGEGRNAVHLAALGHRVTAQDLSVVGLEKARSLAAQRGLQLKTLEGDLADWRAAPASLDLVVAIWMHLPAPLRARVLREAVSALRPGGVLVLEAYTPRQLGRGSGGPPVLELLWSRCSWSESCRGWTWTSCGNVCARSRKGATTRETALWCTNQGWDALPAPCGEANGALHASWRAEYRTADRGGTCSDRGCTDQARAADERGPR